MALLIHDPSQVDKRPKRIPITVSYWQRGCSDAKAGRPFYPPSKWGEHDRSDTGYANGYNYGQAPVHQPASAGDSGQPLAPAVVGAMGENVGINGLTEAETSATASVFGLSAPAPQPQPDGRTVE